MKPIIPNPKEPWKVCPKQLAELDNYIKTRFPDAKLDEGVRYRRWTVLDGLVAFAKKDDLNNSFAPDNVFVGKIFSKEVTILMWLPFFEV